jgi:HPt (histidine-containing phosphotransfer) domain-containing protein
MADSRFRVEIDPDIADLVPQFLENREKDLLSLEDLIRSKNASSISQLAHKIKGSAAGYGFDELSQIAASMETAAKEENFHLIEKLYQDAQQYLKSVEVIYPH